MADTNNTTKAPPASPARRSATLTGASLLSSPPRAPSSRGKERRNPSITPRKFQRFFTPRSRVSSRPSAVRKALYDLAAPALNRCQTPSSPLKPISEELSLPRLPDAGDAHRGKRRKFHHATPEKQTSHLPTPLNSSPLLPTPDFRPTLRSPIQSLRSRQALQDGVYRDDDVSEDEEDVEAAVPALKRPVPLHHRGLGAQLVQRMTGAMRYASERALECPVAGTLPSAFLPEIDPDCCARLEDRDRGFPKQARRCSFFIQPRGSAACHPLLHSNMP